MSVIKIGCISILRFSVVNWFRRNFSSDNVGLINLKKKHIFGSVNFRFGFSNRVTFEQLLVLYKIIKAVIQEHNVKRICHLPITEFGDYNWKRCVGGSSELVSLQFLKHMAYMSSFFELGSYQIKKKSGYYFHFKFWIFINYVKINQTLKKF